MYLYLELKRKQIPSLMDSISYTIIMNHQLTIKSIKKQMLFLVVFILVGFALLIPIHQIPPLSNRLHHQ